MNIRLILDPVRRFFFMKQAIVLADEHARKCRQVGVSQARAARSLLAAAESFDSHSERRLGVVVILREAAVAATQSFALRRRVDAAEGEFDATWAKVLELEELQPFVRTLSQEGRERLTRIVVRGLVSDDYALSPSELREVGRLLFGLVRYLVVELESDVLLPRRLRLGRILRSALVLAVLVGGVGWAIDGLRELARSAPTNDGSTNVALQKSVRMSSSWRNDAYAPDLLVDGDTKHLGCHSENEKNPWVVIDLGERFNVHEVVVTNRLDGHTEFASPLLIETSNDGKRFKTFARQAETFKTWNAKGKTTVARYVRLTVQKESILHLNEVAVY